MSTPSQGTSGPGGGAGFQPAYDRLKSTEQSIHHEIRRLTYTVRTLHEESSVTKEKIDALLKELDRLGLKADGGDVANALQPTRSDAALAALERIKEKLQDLPDRIENVGRVGNDGNTKDVSDLLDDIRDTVVDCQSVIVSASIPGELPPPAPRAFFGREELTDKIVGHAEKLEPVALIGAGGIGKTAIALTVLDDDRIKARFGDNRRFIRCDQFPASRTHFLARLSQVIGAGVKNPEDLAPLRPLLSSKEMIIVLDNAESILDPQGTDHQEIYTLVDELCQFKTLCLLITSCITTVPRYCKRPQILTLSEEAACEIFYGIYGNGERCGTINNLLQHLEFHALSITLLATTASDNVWDHIRLAEEWEEQRAQVLQTDHNESLAATIELSLASPTFCHLGPNARDLLGVVAFFPQGVDEENLDWFFPTIPNRKNIFDKFCALSLTHRSSGFITMLAPIRDYIYPQDPKASPFLCATKDHYFTQLSANPEPSESLFGETQWIIREDVNVEHLLDVFTSTDTNAVDAWNACSGFLHHLYWHKPRQTTLGTKIEGLPDGHPSKTRCLHRLAHVSEAIGKIAEGKQLLTQTLTLEKEQGNDFGIAEMLQCLSSANEDLGIYEEGIQQAKEALEMFQRLGNVKEQLNCLTSLAVLFLADNQLDAAEDTILHSFDLLLLPTKKSQEYHLCQSHQLLGNVYNLKGEKEKALHHYKTALMIASPFSWQYQLFAIHWEMAHMFLHGGEFDDANAHIKQAKLHVADDLYKLGDGMKTQAQVWYKQHRLEDARSEVVDAYKIYERLGAAEEMDYCHQLFHMIEQAVEGSSIPSGSDSDSEQAIECSCIIYGSDSDTYWTAPSTPIEDFQEFDQGSEQVSHP
ncbi:hypothetical protein BJ322DRAFT_295993 [Thelephora terrestris]|uniref:TPR-like protein n=1 Tax=Thelephora terrestris TaxID=56493 RepID=A0A9P6H817_9AGAM|nr:hypothetical protein BJ322DRAFT_295993 [Thelephora terrestris]